ncbi:MAG: hypothetical protein AAGH64_09520 [Planctomycetota bacterium]
MSTHTPDQSLQTRLRLVRPPVSALTLERGNAPRVGHARADEVARANLTAATIGVDELREAFSTRIAESLEGGKSAILRPERRERLVDLGTRMGIRPFDAHLMIALTQDAARRGEVVSGSSDTEPLPTTRPGPAADPVYVLAAGALLGIALAMAGIFWFLRV